MSMEFNVYYLRTTVGVVDMRTFRTLKELYDWFNQNDEEVVITGIEENYFKEEK